MGWLARGTGAGDAWRRSNLPVSDAGRW